jgi:hypothetical protein
MTIPNRSYGRCRGVTASDEGDRFDEMTYFALKTVLAAATLYYVYHSSLLPFVIGMLTGSIVTVIFGCYSITSLSAEVWDVVFDLFGRIKDSPILSKSNLTKLACDLLMFKLREERGPPSRREADVPEEVKPKPGPDSCTGKCKVSGCCTEKSSTSAGVTSFNAGSTENGYIRTSVFDTTNANLKCRHCKDDIEDIESELVDTATGYIFHKECSVLYDFPQGTLLFQTSLEKEVKCDHCQKPISKSAFYIDCFVLHDSCLGSWNVQKPKGDTPANKKDILETANGMRFDKEQYLLDEKDKRVDCFVCKKNIHYGEDITKHGTNPVHMDCFETIQDVLCSYCTKSVVDPIKVYDKNFHPACLKDFLNLGCVCFKCGKFVVDIEDWFILINNNYHLKCIPK